MQGIHSDLLLHLLSLPTLGLRLSFDDSPDALSAQPSLAAVLDRIHQPPPPPPYPSPLPTTTEDDLGPILAALAREGEGRVVEWLCGRRVELERERTALERVLGRETERALQTMVQVQHSVAALFALKQRNLPVLNLIESLYTHALLHSRPATLGFLLLAPSGCPLHFSPALEHLLPLLSSPDRLGVEALLGGPLEGEGAEERLLPLPSGSKTRAWVTWRTLVSATDPPTPLYTAVGVVLTPLDRVVHIL